MYEAQVNVTATRLNYDLCMLNEQAVQSLTFLLLPLPSQSCLFAVKQVSYLQSLTRQYLHFLTFLILLHIHLCLFVFFYSSASSDHSLLSECLVSPNSTIIVLCFLAFCASVSLPDCLLSFMT